jgi:MFS family permease
LTPISGLTKLTLLLLAVTTMMSNVAIITVIPHLKDIFKIDNIELYSRLIVTLPSCTIAFLAPFLGHFVHKVGKKKSVIFALILFTLTGTAGFYLQSIEQILISRAIFGISVAVLMIVSTSLVGDYFKGDERHKFMGIQMAFTSVGGVLFVAGGGMLSDISWHYPFLIYSIGIFLLPFVIKYISKVEIYQKINEEETVDNKVFFIYVLAFILMVIFYILPTQMPFLIMNHFHASGSLAGAIISLAFVFNGLGALSFAKLKKHFSFSTIYLIGLSIIGIGFTIIGLIDNVTYFFFTSTLMGFGGGLLMTCVTSWMLTLVSPEKRVKSSAYLTSSIFMGQFFSPILTMPLVHIFGVQKFFEIFGLFLLVVLIIILLKRKF